MLACKIFGRTEVRVHVLIVIVSDECNILCVFLIQRYSDLEISVDRTVENVRSPWIDFALLEAVRVPLV